jgi:hypothetical protein
MEYYTHKQSGSLMVGIITAGLICMLILMGGRGVDRVIMAYMVVLGVCGFIFSSMTVTIEDDLLTIRFGLKIIRKRLALSEIESCHVVQNPWYYGWGIRRIAGGWLFSVSGRSAVEVIMRSGKRYRIGSDEPKELADAIRQHIDGRG